MGKEERKVIPFRNGKEGISRELLSRLLEKGKQFSLDAVIPVSTKEIIVADWVHLKCRYGCSRYNSSWCCPPATPTPEKARAILGEYSLALLLAGTQRCPGFYRNEEGNRARQIRYWKGTLSFERMLFLEGYYKAFGLVGECCALCRECAFPENCRFPQEKRPTVESFSIDVIGTMQRIGITAHVAVQEKDTFSYYGMILLE
jgi:predicted metal-binding protein